MDKYMEQAVRDYKAIEPPTMTQVSEWATERRASELRLLDMLRRIDESYLVLPLKLSCDLDDLLAEYKDVKTEEP